MTEIDYSTIKTLKKQVYWVLENRPETRNSDALLTETICAHFVDRFGLKYVPLKISETVGRCRRKIQSEGLFLPTNPKVAKQRNRNVDEYRVAMGYPTRDGGYTPPSLRDERTKEYMLVATKIHPSTGTRIKLVVIDKLPATGIREAESDLKKRNNFKRLLEKNDLTIVRSERFYQ